MSTVFIVGTAGSGKSTLVGTLMEWLERNQYSVVTVNLDPAVEYLPYIADIDIRDFISARRLMKKYRLGPNASIIAAVDMMLLNIEKIREEVQALEATYILIDTPGQMELFAFRKTGSLLIDRLSSDKCITIFVIDATQARTPTGFVSSILLSLSTQFRFNKPQINVLNKIDLLDKSELEQILAWSEEPEELQNALKIEAESIGRLEYELNVKVSEFISLIGTLSKVIPISAKTGEGMDDLCREIEQILRTYDEK